MADMVNFGDTGYSTPENNPNILTNSFDDAIGSNSADSDEWYAPYIKDNPAWKSFIEQGKASGVDYTQGEARKMLESIFYGNGNPSAADSSSSSAGYGNGFKVKQSPWTDKANDIDWTFNQTDADERYYAYNKIYKTFGQLMDYYSKMQQEFNQGSADRAMDFEAEQARINREWQEMMSNTAYQRAVEDMRKAGINPLLGFFNSSGMASTPSGATASGHSAGSSMVTPNQLLSNMIQLLLYGWNSTDDVVNNVLGYAKILFSVLTGMR